jgi:streptogramin lyase
MLSAADHNVGSNNTSSSAKFYSPNSVVVDYAGNIFLANASGSTNAGSVSELTAASSYSGANFAPAGANFFQPVSLGLDNSGNVWVTNESGTGPNLLGRVRELPSASSYSSGQNFNPPGASFHAPNALAIDSNNNIWVVNSGGDSISELPAGNYDFGVNYAPAGAEFDSPTAIAIDETGNLWIPNVLGNSNQGSVSEMIGLARPVLTPTQACVKLAQLNQNVCLP